MAGHERRNKQISYFNIIAKNHPELFEQLHSSVTELIRLSYDTEGLMPSNKSLLNVLESDINYQPLKDNLEKLGFPLSRNLVRRIRSLSEGDLKSF